MDSYYIISLCIAGLSLLISMCLTFKKDRKENIDNVKKETTEFTTVLVELKYISQGISDIKNDVIGVKVEQQQIRDRVVAGEQSIKQAHKRLDEYELRLDSIK